VTKTTPTLPPRVVFLWLVKGRWFFPPFLKQAERRSVGVPTFSLRSFFFPRQLSGFPPSDGFFLVSLCPFFVTFCGSCQGDKPNVWSPLFSTASATFSGCAMPPPPPQKLFAFPVVYRACPSLEFNFSPPPIQCYLCFEVGDP